MNISVKPYLNTNNLSLAGNTLSLAFIKGIDMVTQLIVLPRLISVLGIEQYGNIAFYIVVMQYIQSICDFGYNFNATQRIASAKSQETINTVFTSVQLAKLVIMIIVLMALFLFFIVKSVDSIFIVYGLSLFVVFQSFSIDWFFLGSQNMLIIAIYKLICRSFYVLYIYFIISSESSYAEVVLLDCLIPVFMTTLSLITALVFYKIRICKVQRDYVKDLFRESWILYSAGLFITVYRNMNVLLLKLFATPYAVGIYAAVEKVIRACQAIIEPVTTALFPYTSRKYDLMDNAKEKVGFVLSLAKIYISVIVLSVFILFLLSTIILSFVNITPSQGDFLFKIMLIAFAAGSLNYLLGYVGLANMGHNNLFRKAVVYVGCISSVVTLFLIYVYDEIGASISVALSETLLTILLFNQLNKLKKQQA